MTRAELEAMAETLVNTHHASHVRFQDYHHDFVNMYIAGFLAGRDTAAEQCARGTVAEIEDKIKALGEELK